jgi:hypothetical protein
MQLFWCAAAVAVADKHTVQHPASSFCCYLFLLQCATGTMLAAAGTAFGSSLFQLLGAEFLSAFMTTTGAVYSGTLLCTCAAQDRTYVAVRPDCMCKNAHGKAAAASNRGLCRSK